MKTTILTVLLVSAMTLGAFAQSEPLPEVLTDGLKAYQKAGGKAALTVWLKGSPLENDTTTNVNMTGMLSQIEAAYGKMVGYEAVRVVSLCPSLRRAYLVLCFEKGPVYASFDCYKSPEAWVIPQVDMNTKMNLVFPPSMVAGSVQ